MYDEKGQMLIYLAVLLTLAILGIALVLDLGRVYVIRSQLQSAADAAALAGVSMALEKSTYGPDGVVTKRWFEAGENAAEEGYRIFNRNIGEMGLLSNGMTVKVVTIIPEGNTVHVRVTASVKTFLIGPFIKLLYQDSRFEELEISRKATASITP